MFFFQSSSYCYSTVYCTWIVMTSLWWGIHIILLELLFLLGQWSKASSLLPILVSEFSNLIQGQDMIYLYKPSDVFHYYCYCAWLIILYIYFIRQYGLYYSGAFLLAFLICLLSFLFLVQFFLSKKVEYIRSEALTVTKFSEISHLGMVSVLVSNIS